MLHAGADEAGRGTLISRIYASAVILDDSLPLPSAIRDSKKLKPNHRASLRKYIEACAIDYSVVYVDADIIDDINIRQANIMAFNMAIDKLNVKTDIVYIDGNDFIPNEKNKNVAFETIIKGDAKVKAISAASILAKEHHDEYIRELCAIHPDLIDKYDLLSNKRYGTQKHIDGIKKYGPSPYHRYSFCSKWI